MCAPVAGATSPLKLPAVTTTIPVTSSNVPETNPNPGDPFGGTSLKPYRIVDHVRAMMPQLLASGMTILIVEQDVSQALRVASRFGCLLEGRTTLSGRPGEFRPEEIEAAYFGLAVATAR